MERVLSKDDKLSSFEFDRQADLLAILDAGPIMPEDTAFMSRRRQRSAQDGIDALIAYLDATEADPDLEDSGDTEPNCGGFGTYGATDEAEGDDADAEPSLGSLGSYAAADQRQWAAGSRQDLEQDVQDEPHDDTDSGDCEPDLGSLEGLSDQRSWSAHAGRDDEPSLGSPEAHHDQRRWGQGHAGSRELDHDERDARDRGHAAYDRTERVRRETEAMLRRKGLVPDRGHSNVVAFHPDMLPNLRRVF